MVNINRNNKKLILWISSILLLGLVYAGTHSASQITTGNFVGDFHFNDAPTINQSYYYLPKTSDFVVGSANCVDNGVNYKCAYEPDENQDGCPDDMARVGSTCVDKYESSFDCNTYVAQATTGSGGAITTDGASDYDDYLWQTKAITLSGGPAVCKSKSENNSIPYTTIAQYDAKQSCILAGKKLIKNTDWQEAVFGTPDDDTKCNINSVTSGGGTFIEAANWYNQGGDDATYTGTASECVSRYGTYDMIGNVWEWTDDLIDATTNTDYAQTATYGSDYIYRQTVGSVSAREGSANFVSAFLRGGHWNNGANAGAFALSLLNGPSRWSWGIGFRCSIEPLS